MSSTSPGSPRSAIVIGGTGILAPAASELARTGIPVTVVSRSGLDVAEGAQSVRVDATSPGDLRATLGDRHWDLAVVYSPTVSAASLEVLRAMTERVVEVRISAAADPALGDYVDEDDVLQLGWTDDATDGMRWHTPGEVSAAALEVVADGRGRVLGRVRPWTERP